MRRKKIALTLGEPAGIGLDILIQLAQSHNLDDLVIIADPDLLEQRAKLLDLNFNVSNFEIFPVLAEEKNVCTVPSIANVNYVLKTLDIAVSGCLEKKFCALVTGPVYKSIINEAGIPFTGHTEFFAQKSNVKKTLMCFENANMRMVLASTHMPLKEVPNYLTQDRLVEVLILLAKELKEKFNLKQPKIAVCGLNPHAGENGYLGSEEIENIAPAIAIAKSKGIDCSGPYPADTILLQSNFDCIVSMYHDQLLPALKYQNFFDTVNITLGLPFIRTSVDHGTALNLAGTGKSNPASLMAAIEAARRLA